MATKKTRAADRALLVRAAGQLLGTIWPFETEEVPHLVIMSLSRPLRGEAVLDLKPITPRKGVAELHAAVRRLVLKLYPTAGSASILYRIRGVGIGHARYCVPLREGVVDRDVLADRIRLKVRDAGKWFHSPGYRGGKSYRIVDDDGRVLERNVDLVKLGHTLGVIRSDETVADELTPGGRS